MLFRLLRCNATKEIIFNFSRLCTVDHLCVKQKPKTLFLQFIREKNSSLPDKPTVQSAKKKVIKKLDSDDEEPVSQKK